MDKMDLENKIVEDVKKDPLKKYILLLLNSNDKDHIKGKTKFMKELFFISKNIKPLENEADFEADNYGPNSDATANILYELSMLGLIDSERDDYKLTQDGEKILNKVDESSDEEKNIIAFMKDLFNDLTYDESLALVYCNYPDMTSESLVKEKIKSKRKNLALSLLKKEKISRSKAAEIYGVPLRDFYRILHEKGVSIGLG
jgi:uncharacterized protein YwgA